MTEHHVMSGEDEHRMLKVYMPLLSNPDLSATSYRNAGCLEGNRRNGDWCKNRDKKIYSGVKYE